MSDLVYIFRQKLFKFCKKSKISFLFLFFSKPGQFLLLFYFFKFLLVTIISAFSYGRWEFYHITYVRDDVFSLILICFVVESDILIKLNMLKYLHYSFWVCKNCTHSFYFNTYIYFALLCLCIHFNKRFVVCVDVFCL